MAPSTKRRRVSGPSTTAIPASQSTLSFRGTKARVTKAASAVSNSKPGKKDKHEDNDITITPHIDPAEEVEVDSKAEAKPLEATPALAPTKPTPPTVEQTRRTQVETKALSLPPSALTNYWHIKEISRRAPRVHQSDLSLHEKILREFDLTSRFGPCVGMGRKERWWRAEGLGLAPPVEVLAVLLRDEGAEGAAEVGKTAKSATPKRGKSAKANDAKGDTRSVVDRLLDGEVRA